MRRGNLSSCVLSLIKTPELVPIHMITPTGSPDCFRFSDCLQLQLLGKQFPGKQFVGTFQRCAAD